MDKATFAGGCFWCTEAIFKRVKGITKVLSGYTGGKRENPNYQQVSTGVTGHAEAVQLSFDPGVIPYEILLELFWNLHDPTTPNQQGNDIGTQYRSAIFYHSEEQKEKAIEMKKKLAEEKIFDRSIVTEILPFEKFYTAEEYHQDYYDKNVDNPYCNYVITPKVKKLLEKYGDRVKEEYK
jgi:peptide-methionine (S)-S-oxide reductase